eukprot:CAMPEP_0194257250 /NCGR_PEP_ID=MMETSP0158-20130606/38558_1 /TAXON_ID=33649 /ORGANISM="Thalassionema nitzschioides, Strain L26-B" /LENGTH=378 /DNA_ID=CAMNT_0038996227 /DNA_START=294 /DNA_END=1427 /DNA_ORIENTATION=+
MAVDRVKLNYGTAVPTGIYETPLHEPLCSPQCTLRFPLVDLSTLVTVDDFQQNLIGQSSTESKPSLIKDLPINNSNQETDNIASLTKRGFKPGVINQDRIVMYTVKSDDESGFDSDINIFALFDGHGFRGHASAHAAALNLPKVLNVREIGAKNYHTQEEAEEMLTAAMLQLDKLLPQEMGSGCTAIVIVQTKSQILVANVGDSKAVVAVGDSNRTSKIIFETKPHKPHMAQERQRIESKGGRVYVPTNPRETSRVFLPMDGNEGNDMALAMSRSLGDFEGKRPGFLIAEPTVTVIDPEQYKHKNGQQNPLLFLVLATDGLWDYVPTEDVVQSVGQLLSSQEKQLVIGCEELIERASNGWKMNTQSTYRDDISILVSQ